jgi:DNA-binding NarL/FixJ family response regulator
MEPRPTRVLIVDASAAGRARVRAALHARAGLEVVGEAEGAARAADLADGVRPELVVLEADAWLRGCGPTSAPAPAPLSGRRRAILSLVAEGLSNREIAARTNLSALTVKGYVEEILEALGARNRVQAAVLAIRRGLIPPD